MRRIILRCNKLGIFSPLSSFSLLEILVSMAIGSMLALLLSVAVQHAKSDARISQCISNLHQVQVAMSIYQNDYNLPPFTGTNQTLEAILLPYVGSSSKVFNCPEDLVSTNDSYSYYYAVRPDNSDSDRYILGCSRHRKATQGIAIYTGSYTAESSAAPILHDNVATTAGVEYTQGTFTFADGSQVVIGNGSGVSTLFSVRQQKGAIYTLVKMNASSTATFTVTPGNSFEVVTPAAMITVQGTLFTVSTLQVAGLLGTQVVVTTGTVKMTSLPYGQVLTITDTLLSNIGLAIQGQQPTLQ